MLSPELESYSDGLAKAVVVFRSLDGLAGLVADPELARLVALIADEQAEAVRKLAALLPGAEGRFAAMLEPRTKLGPKRPRGGADPSQN